MQLKIIKGDITKIECDAIVNSASTNLVPSGAIDTAIHKAAGAELAKACYRVQPCKIGNCVYTKAFKLPCHYVIHAVAPYSAHTTAAHFLASCYKNAIKLAQSLKCASIAFPLLGSGHKGFPVDKALSVALNRIDACMRDDDYDRELLIYLVVCDDETLALAKSKAKEVIKEDYLIDDVTIDAGPDPNADFRPEPFVYPGENHWISLCRVNNPDKNEQIWMRRIADIKDGTLVVPVFDSNKEQIFDNRPLIFHKDGPSDPDSIGFWEWAEEQVDIGHWRVKAAYIEELSPTEILLLDDFTTVGEIVDTLKTGIHIPAYIRCNVIFAVRNETHIEGVLCDLSNFNSRPGNDEYIELKNDVWTLPCYELSEDDILVYKNRRIYKHVEINEPARQIPVYMPAETIKQLFLQRTTWPVFKAQGISKSDWQKFRQFLNAIPDASILGKLSEMYGVSLEEAQNTVDVFLQNIESYVQVDDVDSRLIVQMLNSHRALRKSCDAIAYQRWQAEHKDEVKQAQDEVAAIRNQAEGEIEAAKQQLLDLKNAIDFAEKQQESLLLETASAQSRLDQLMTDIEQYESIGKDALAATRQKIADAQKDMAGFIADLSVFLPQNTSSGVGEKTSLWQYSSASFGVYPEDDIDVAESWEDELNSLTQNFAHVLDIPNEFSAMLAAFVYAAHINGVPLLIAGPGGCEIAEALSVSLYGSSAGHLTLGNEYDCDIADGIKVYRENIVSVQNMFGKGWSDILPQVLGKLKKQIIWTHPYVEDMMIEPKGLYNYMLPVFSECFVGSSSGLTLWPGKRAEKFVPFVSRKKNRLRTSGFGQLKLSRLLMNQLEKVLSDAKEILNNSNAEKDVEILFGLLPLSVLTGRTDVLKEVMETETGISNAIKEEAARYIEEV